MRKGLVLGGGGVFGIGQAHILSKVDVSKFDFFVGTSIGSVICSTLASDLKFDSIEFFHKDMPKIFVANPFSKLNIFKPKYPDKELNRALKSIFGENRKLMDVKKPLFITAANLPETKLKVFTSEDLMDSNMLMWEVARSAVAAETYFKPWNGYADGGVFANNPSMVAVASACMVLNYDIRDIQLCFIGTGSGTNSERFPSKNYSLFTWGKWILSALMRGASNSMHDYFVRSLPVNKYVSIEFKRQAGWKMDSPKDMLLAEKAWDLDIKKGIQLVNEF